MGKLVLDGFCIVLHGFSSFSILLGVLSLRGDLSLSGELAGVETEAVVTGETGGVSRSRLSNPYSESLLAFLLLLLLGVQSGVD